jgi:hypothetical protein
VVAAGGDDGGQIQTGKEGFRRQGERPIRGKNHVAPLAIVSV